MRTTPAKRQTYFSEYLPQHVVQFGLRAGHFFTGTFRVNAKDSKEGYVTAPGFPTDVLFYMQRYQNRAVDGDEVVFEIPPVSEWRYKLGNNVTVPEPPPSSSNSDGDITDLDSLPGALEFWTFVANRSGRTPGDLPWSNARSRQEVLQHIYNVLRQRPEMRVMGRVVSVLTPSPRRERVVGVLHPMQGSKHLILLPMDPRLPRQCLVQSSQTDPIPQQLLEEANATTEVTRRTLVQVSITGWEASSERPACRFAAIVGPAGDKNAELAALRAMHGLEDLGFSDEAMACLPPLPWSISEKDEAERRDFRTSRIVSIDPPTARDLDDALSIEPLPNGNYKVGVHIADVAHFVPPRCQLDKEALERATSIYLVDRVIPMLPRLLCEELCSLNPGVDRLSFSVEWELTPDGVIKDQWIGRSIICTCAKLSYLHAQDMIDGTFDIDTANVELHKGHSWDQVTEDVCMLNRIARRLRASRFANGALRMDNPKLTFGLDEEGNPASCSLYTIRESNQLIEEFMLLANMSIATFIADVVPSSAVLRRHPSPEQYKLMEVQRAMMNLGYQIDITSAGALNNSLEQLRGDNCDKVMSIALQIMVTKPMMLALYFCTGATPDERDWRHYALNVPRYTHFTSPIRRYPDIMVHRALAAALEIKARPEGRPHGQQLNEILFRHGLEPATRSEQMADHCNKRRVVAREAQEKSGRLFLALMLRDKPMVCTAVVTQVAGDRYLPAVLPELGCECRIALDGSANVKVSGQWDNNSKTLSVKAWDVEAELKAAEAQKRKPANGDEEDFDAEAWNDSLRNLHNPKQLPPLTLPFQPECLQCVPVVVGAHMSSKIKGHPNDIMVRLYVEGMPDGLPVPPAVQLPAAGQRASVMEEGYELE